MAESAVEETSEQVRVDQEKGQKAREGSDWPQLLGPDRTGISSETGLIKEFGRKGPKVLWKYSIGEGYSAPSVSGDRLVYHDRLLDEEVVHCVSAEDGSKIWTYRYPSDYIDPFGYNNGPRCSPILTEDHVFTFGAEGILLCLELKSGKKVWQVNVHKEFKIPEAFFGIGSTPLIEGNQIIVMVGGAPSSGIVSFDRKTGKKIWESVGLTDFVPPKGYRYVRDQKLSSYSSPMLATIHGKKHLLCLMRPGLVSLNPEDGSVRFTHFFRAVERESVNAAQPVVVGNKIFISAAYEVGAALLEVAADDTINVIWKEELAMQNHWSTCIHHDGYLYGFSGRHEPGSNFRCIRMSDGKLMWETVDVNRDDAPDAMQGLGQTIPNFYGRGSAVMADGRFYVLGERGLLAIVERTPEAFRELSRFKFPELRYPCWSAPVISRKRMWIRSEDYLMCLDLAE